MLIVYELYALPQESAVALLSAERSGAARYRRVAELRKTGGARLEALNAITNKSGQRCILESVDEVRYPSDFDNLSEAKPEEGKPANPAPLSHLKAGVVYRYILGATQRGRDARGGTGVVPGWSHRGRQHRPAAGKPGWIS